MSKPKSNLKWSLNKSTVKLIQSLKQQKFRKEHGLFVVEGRKMVKELLQSNMKTLCLYATERFLRDYEINDDRLEIATEIQMEQMSGQDTPPGILAVVEVPQPRAIKEEGMILALDGIANPGNMGTIIRTAEWFGMNQIVCSEDCVELWNPKVIQATMGSIFRMNVTSVNLASYLDEAKKSGKAIYGALLDGENIFSKERWDDGVIVIGSESHGIRSEVLHYITHPITIPRAEGSITESLNASMAAGIIMAEIRNR
ncbi:MAG: RNA methyltransferase [Bacteroidales bacterium]|nr:RNA methyltransferase [Bacteroidales bacterium]